MILDTGSRIEVNAFRGSGGNIQIQFTEGRALFQSEDSLIDAAPALV